MNRRIGLMFLVGVFAGGCAAKAGTGSTYLLLDQESREAGFQIPGVEAERLALPIDLDDIEADAVRLLASRQDRRRGRR